MNCCYNDDVERDGYSIHSASIYLLFNGQSLKIQREEIHDQNPLLKRRVKNEIRLIRKYLDTKVLDSILQPEFGFNLEFSDYEERLYPKDFFNPEKKYEVTGVKSGRKAYSFRSEGENDELFFLSIKSIDD